MFMASDIERYKSAGRQNDRNRQMYGHDMLVVK